TIATSCKDGTVKLWNPAVREQVKNFKAFPPDTLPYNLSPDGKWVAAVNANGKCQLTEIPSLEDRRSFQGSMTNIATVAVSVGGKLVALGMENRTVELWRESSLLAVLPSQGESSAVQGMEFSLDSRMLAIARTRQPIRLWDTVANKEIGTLESHRSRIN